MQPPHNRKEIQKLTGQIVALKRFIAKLEERSISFFTMHMGSTKIEWEPEQQEAFEDLKLYLERLPTLSSLDQGQPLILYVSTMHSAVSTALVVEKEIIRDGKIVKK
jgi:hypothetical protein